MNNENNLNEQIPSTLNPNVVPNNGEIPNDLQIKITNTIGKYGNEIINYEVEPLSIDGCSHISD